MSISDFIKDEVELKKFYDSVLVPLEQDEVYYFALSARKKYLIDDSIKLKKGSDMLNRKILRKNGYEAFRNTILELFSPAIVGRYLTQEGEPIPISAYSAYIGTNKRNTRRSCLEIVNKITEGLMNTNTTLNIETMMLSAVHKSCFEKNYIDFDCDVGEGDDGEKIRKFVEDALGDSEYHTIKTRGGYHILLNIKTIDSKIKNTFYNNIKDYSDGLNNSVIEFMGKTNLLPIPGFAQGGFTPYIMDK